jgi:hypothetical protein
MRKREDNSLQNGRHCHTILPSSVHSSSAIVNRTSNCDIEKWRAACRHLASYPESVGTYLKCEVLCLSLGKPVNYTNLHWFRKTEIFCIETVTFDNEHPSPRKRMGDSSSTWAESPRRRIIPKAILFFRGHISSREISKQSPGKRDSMRMCGDISAAFPLAGRSCRALIQHQRRSCSKWNTRILSIV